MSNFFKRWGAASALTVAGIVAGVPGYAQTVDGTRDGSYPAALAVQTNATGFGDATQGNQEQNDGANSGSELDNIHAQITNVGGIDYLYIFLGGNLQTNFNKLDIFIDSKAGGQNQLRGDNPVVDFNGLNRMAGLRFDAAFTSDYYITMGAGNNPLEVYTNFAQTPTSGGGLGAFAGGGTGRTHTVDFDPSGAVKNGIVSIDNSNTAGVDGGSVGSPGAVSTGIELRIPLSAIGAAVQSGDIRVIAFINGGGHDYMSNQLLGGLPGSTPNLGRDGAGCGDGTCNPFTVNLNSFFGDQFVTVPNAPPAPAPDIALDPTAIPFFNVGVAAPAATRILEISNNGNATLNVSSITSNNPLYSVNISNFSLAAGLSQNVVVSFDPNAPAFSTGTLSINSNDPDSPLRTVPLSGRGIAAGQVIVDGSLDALYGSALSLQDNTTAFGDNQSELNGAYARISNGKLHVFLTGNLEAGGNRLVLFFDNSPKNNNSFFAAGAWPSIGNSDALDGLTFEPSFSPEYMIALNTFGSDTYADFAQIGQPNSFFLGSASPNSQTLTFPSNAVGELAVNNSNSGGVNGTTNPLGNPAAVTTGIELVIPLVDIAPGFSADMPLRMLAFISNGNFDFLSNQVLGGIGAGSPAGNVGNLGAPAAINFGDDVARPGTQFVTLQAGNVTVVNGETVDLKGAFKTIQVNNGGVLKAYGDLSVTQGLNMIGGAEADFAANTARLTGAGFFKMNGDGTVRVRNSGGISTSGPSGAIQVTGLRTYRPGVYEFVATPGGVTGTGLPGTVRQLLIKEPTLGAGGLVTLSQNVNVSQKVLAGGANLNLDGRTLRLLSDGVTGTALIENAGSGVVLGPTGKMECGLDASYLGVAYRHYGSPVTGQTIAGLVAPGYQPVIDPGYNTLPRPNYTAQTFPNIFTFDESLAQTVFEDGYQSPTSLGAVMGVGEGFTIRLNGRPELTFSGAFNNGDKSVGLSRTGSDPNNAGWNLVSNPFPSPIDWDNVTIPSGMSGQVSVQKPLAGPNGTGGVYLIYQNGVGTLTDGIIPAAQGIFVRRTGGATSFTFEQAARVTTFGANTIHYRTAPESRPLLQLTVAGTNGMATMADDAFVYFESGATAGQDDRYDATRVGFSTGAAPSISTRLSDGALAQIDGRPVLTRDLEIPLDVRVNVAGTYVINAAQLINFATDQPILLVDAVTGTVQDLRTTPTYRFTMDPATANNGRFSLRFGAGAAGNTVANALLSVYPNPSNGNVTVEWAGNGTLIGSVTLTDLLGRAVRDLPAGAARLTLRDLPKGVYTLRVVSPEGPLTRRVVVE